ncbi:transcriptional regulator [Metallosphaera javensis (ex Sakai et al. 2022)]|uniref:transcriptional regulator n=1 Tax=Metallosphaera javensis (ex Sakai et al. 2022) TaxID=2775498 RepID=UPI00258E77F7|nr:MAG: ArsR family transcriptional regulator [Metallosphaera javensis (ex Sakai et al. 2022)]
MENSKDAENKDSIKDLLQFLNNRALNNSVRLGILIALSNFERLSFSELLEYTKIQKSSLYMHLQVLEEEGLITIKKQFTLSGPRTYASITDKGKDTIKKYFDLVNKLK